MPGVTPNFNFAVYSALDTQTKFLTYRMSIAGSQETSNFYILDTVLGQFKNSIVELQNRSSITYVQAIYSIVTANYYEAETPNYTSYTPNEPLIININVQSSGPVTLNINSLGTREIVKYNAEGTLVPLEPGDFRALKDYLVINLENQWVWVGATSADQMNIQGTTGNAISISDNNTFEDSGKGFGLANGIATTDADNNLIQGLRVNSVNTDNITNLAITNEKLGLLSVNTGNLIDNSVTTPKLANGSVSADKLASNSVTTIKLANGSVTIDKMAANSVGTTQIVDGSINSSKLAASSVGTSQLADLSVTNNKIANATIAGSKLVNGTVGTTQLATSSVGTSQLMDGAVTSAKIASGVIEAIGDTRYLQLTGGTITGNLIVKNTSGQIYVRTDIASIRGVRITTTVPSGAVGDLHLTANTIQLEAQLNANNNKITGLATPSSITDAVNKSYVDDKFMTIIGGTFTGTVKANPSSVTGVNSNMIRNIMIYPSGTDINNVSTPSAGTLIAILE